MANFRVCRSCRDSKCLETEFYPSRSKTNPFRNECKKCTYARSDKGVRKAAGEKMKERFREDPRIPLVYGAKARAKKKGLPFDIEVGDITIPEVCPVFGTPISRGVEFRSDASPSIDRIDPKRGYVKGNVAVISFRANRFKQDATPEELRRVAEWFESVISPSHSDTRSGERESHHHLR